MPTDHCDWTAREVMPAPGAGKHLGQPKDVVPNQEHTYLVAITMAGPITREQGEKVLHRVLPNPEDFVGCNVGVEQWWIAEDDRADGSDNDSAVFVHLGYQERANAVLTALL